MLPQVIQIGFISIHLYSLCIFVAIIFGLYFFNFLLTKSKKAISIDIWKEALYVLVAGIIGARIYHVVTDFHLYKDNIVDIFYIWQGGLGITGGLIAGGIAVIWRTKKHNISTQLVLSTLAVVVPFSQAIGRLGNMFNYELFGLPTTLPWGINVPPKFRPEEYANYSTFHPLFLYEAIGNLILGFLLFYLWRKDLYRNKLLVIYMLCYGFIRFCLDFIRITGNTGWEGLSYTQWLIIIIYIIIIIHSVIYSVIKNKWKGIQ